MESQMQNFVASQEADYRRLACHLHDDIGQLLTALGMHLQLAGDQRQLDSQRHLERHLEQCLAINKQLLEQVRDMSLDLSPSLLEDVGLPDSLRYYLDRQSQRTGLAIHLVTSTAWNPLSRAVEAVCFRVTQEAVRNVIRHASARRIQVELRQDAEAVHLTISDDGVGFDPASLEQEGVPHRKLGLTAMRQRVELLTGRWSLESAPGQGTLIRVSLPVDPT
jgi:signal transduction histidine kinase